MRTQYLILLLVLSFEPVEVSFAQSIPVNQEAFFSVPTHADGIQRTTIYMESYTFSPSRIVVKALIPIELTFGNESFLVPHNFVLDIPSQGLHIEQSIDAGEVETIRFTLEKPGEFTFYCNKQLLFFPSHQEEGMEGIIRVVGHE